MENAEWSRKIAYAISVNQPDENIRINLRHAYEKAKSPSQLPKWVLDFVQEANIENKNVSGNLIKAGRNVIAEALQLLDDLPDIKPGLIAVPWPVSPRPELDPTVWEESVIQDVKVADLVATQKLMNRDRVEFYVKNPGAIEENRRAYANVYAIDSELLIVDGHHRLAALWLLGAEVANIWFLEE